MIRGILVVLGLVVLGAVLGFLAGLFWASTMMPNAELEAILPPLVGTVVGAVAGLATGIGVAYALGKRGDGS